MSVFAPRIAACILASVFAFASPVLAEDASAHPGPKKTVVVSGFEAPELMQGGATADELTALLVNALIADGRFVVLERPDLIGVRTEQQIAQQTQTSLSAGAIIRGTVTKFDAAAGGTSLGVGGLPFLGGGGAAANSQTAEVTISLRVIDVNTSQILFTGSATGHASAKSLGVTGTTGLYSWNAGGFLKTPLGQALEDAIRKGVDQIAVGMAKVPWSAQVIDNDGGQVYITAGNDQGIWQGAVFHVYRKGKVLTDPTTGATLDVLFDPVGTITVQTVRDKVSIATVSDGSVPARGDIVRLN
jgi:curli biogenesis system outer membrane secretion channel CsgG